MASNVLNIKARNFYHLYSGINLPLSKIYKLVPLECPDFLNAQISSVWEDICTVFNHR